MSAPIGNKYNTKGRPGAKNKKTLEWEAFRNHCLTGGLTKFNEEINALKGEKYVHAFISLLEFCKPKLARQVDKNGNDAKQSSITVIITNERDQNTNGV